MKFLFKLTPQCEVLCQGNPKKLRNLFSSSILILYRFYANKSLRYILLVCSLSLNVFCHTIYTLHSELVYYISLLCRINCMNMPQFILPRIIILLFIFVLTATVFHTCFVSHTCLHIFWAYNED